MRQAAVNKFMNVAQLSFLIGQKLILLILPFVFFLYGYALGSTRILRYVLFLRTKYRTVFFMPIVNCGSSCYQRNKNFFL